jgi:hypothetical protein
MKMIEIWLKITFIFINGHDFQSGIKSVCDECKNKDFFLYLENRNFLVFQVRIIVWVCEAPSSGNYLRLSPLDF